MPTNNKLKIAVCDDDRRDCIEIINQTKKVLQEEKIFHSITAYDNAKALLADIQKGVVFQILLLDVVMDEMDGMELARELRKMRNNAAIIFISVNSEKALSGYEVSAARYLGKPLEEEKLREALLYCSRNQQEKKEILLPTAQGKCRISVADIQYAEAYERGTRVVLKSEAIECRLKFSEMEAMLPKPTFLLCHRAYIVNLSCVKYIRNYEFELKSGQIIPIGKGRYGEIQKKFVSYLTD